MKVLNTKEQKLSLLGYLAIRKHFFGSVMFAEVPLFLWFRRFAMTN